MGLIVGWRQFSLLLPPTEALGYPQFGLVLSISLLVVVPVLFLHSFRQLSWLSSLSLFCAMLLCLGAVGLVTWDPTR